MYQIFFEWTRREYIKILAVIVYLEWKKGKYRPPTLCFYRLLTISSQFVFQSCLTTFTTVTRRVVSLKMATLPLKKSTIVFVKGSKDP